MWQIQDTGIVKEETLTHWRIRELVGLQCAVDRERTHHDRVELTDWLRWELRSRFEECTNIYNEACESKNVRRIWTTLGYLDSAGPRSEWRRRQVLQARRPGPDKPVALHSPQAIQAVLAQWGLFTVLYAARPVHSAVCCKACSQMYSVTRLNRLLQYCHFLAYYSLFKSQPQFVEERCVQRVLTSNALFVNSNI